MKIYFLNAIRGSRSNVSERTKERKGVRNESHGSSTRCDSVASPKPLMGNLGWIEIPAPFSALSIDSY